MHVVKELCYADASSGVKCERDSGHCQDDRAITMMADQFTSHSDKKSAEHRSSSHGYMPRHFSSRSHGWLVAIGKACPHGDCVDPPVKCTSSGLLESDMYCDDLEKPVQRLGSCDPDETEFSQSSCPMTSCVQFDITQPLDTPDETTNSNCRSHDDVRLFKMSCRSDNVEEKTVQDETLVEHRLSDDTSDELRRNVTVSSASDVRSCHRIETRLTRQWSSSSNDVFIDDHEKYCDTTINSFGFEDPNMYIRKNSDQPLKRAHRSMSDLGLCKNVPTLNRSNSRLRALLQNPILRRSLAQTMKLDPNKETFDDHVFEKLSTKMDETFDLSVPIGNKFNSVSESSIRLCCSTSDLGMLTNWHQCLGGSEVKKSINFEHNIGQHDCSELDNITSDNKQNSNEMSCKKVPSNPSSSRVIATSPKQLSSFRIPSYMEFKAERRQQRFLSKSAANLASLVPTILEEEDSVGEGYKLAKNMSADSRLVDKGVGCYVDTASSTAYEKVKDNKDNKEETSLQNRSHYRSDYRLSSVSNPSISSHTEGCSLISDHITSHHKIIDGFQECEDNHYPEEGVSGICGDQCSANFQIGCHMKTAEINSMFSDYASESNDEFSDGLEDVLLKPTMDPKSRHMCHSDLSCTLDECLSNPALVEVFSDSGCLVDKKSFESELASEDGTCLDLNEQDGAMLRSSSDVSEMFAEELRMRGTREPRNKQSKSDPLNIIEEKGNGPGSHASYLQRKDSKEDVIKFLEKNIYESKSSTIDIDACHDSYFKHHNREVVISKQSMLERVDSGVGKDSVDDPVKTEVTNCEDCGDKICHSGDDDGNLEDSLICIGCNQRRYQRKEAVVEIIDTEQNYGNDLNIINEHFFETMKNMGLLNAEQLKIIFINLAELISVNRFFLTQLKSALGTAAKMNDELLWSVNIGELFLNSSNMLLAYESYCVNQSAAPVLLDKLLEEKDLLRIFLDVTQREKSVLRKMDLKSFLMVPVQRVMKYPLLLNRLYKVTPSTHRDFDNINQARRKIENILELINSKTKGSSMGRLRRRTSSLHRSQDLDNSAYENIEVHKVVMEALDWDASDIYFLKEGCLLCAAITDNVMLKRAKSLKYTQVHGVIISLNKNFSEPVDVRSADFFKCSRVQSAALVLLKEKGNKPQLFRDPFLLHQCIVCLNHDNMDYFEVHDANKESLLMKCKDPGQMQEWFKQLHSLVFQLSRWRHRRNALANIMLHDL